VQVYVGAVVSRVPRPARELKAFRKVEIAAGQAVTVEFKLGRRDFAFFDPDAGKWTVEGGEFEITVGPHSRSGLTGRLVVPADGG
jgi:beta-glucosidase